MDLGDDVVVDRVAVVGPGGAGKSTFSNRLGARLGVPVVHLDEHYWRPGWLEPTRDVWRAQQRELFAGERWIADGNYGSTLDVRLAIADCVIVLMPSRLTCVAGALRRVTMNHGRAVQAVGCPERFDLAFLRYVWRYPIDSRPRLDEALQRYADRLEVIELRSRQEADTFLARLPCLNDR